MNGADEETWRAIRHLRMTVMSGRCSGVYPETHPRAGDPACAEAMLFARMRVTGSSWKKREIEGVIAGLIGTDTIPGDHSRNVHVGPVSSLTDGSAYLGPPGAADEASEPTMNFGASGIEVNEKALRIAFTDLEADARAEVFYRFPSETRSFMEYQQMRMWALPRAGDWGPDGTLSLLIKIGTDDENYYLYRTRLRPPVENRDIDTRGYWLPEVVIDFEPWFQLKARAETLAAQNGAGGDTLWNEAGTHAIVLSSRAQAPNLAAIRELSLAIHNESGLPADSAELWVNDLRLGNGRTDAGLAGYVSIDARAADFATVRLSLANQGALFHPMNRDATLEGTNDIGVNGRFELGHFAPAGWGLMLPVTVQHTQQDRAPEFLNRTDIRAADLEGLRSTGQATTTVGMSLAKATPAANPWLGLLVDGTRVNLNWRDASRDIGTQSNTTGQFTGLAVVRASAPGAADRCDAGLPGRAAAHAGSRTRRGVGLLRPHLGGEPALEPERDLVRHVLPGSREQDAELPERARDAGRRAAARDRVAGRGPGEHRFDRIPPVRVAERACGHELVARPALAGGMGDQPLRSARSRGRAHGPRRRGPRLGEAPLAERDHRAAAAHQQLAAADHQLDSDYRTDRTPHYLDFVVVPGDTVGALDTLDASMQRNFDVEGRLERRLNFDPGGLARAAWGAERSPELGVVRGALHRLGVGAHADRSDLVGSALVAVRAQRRRARLRLPLRHRRPGGAARRAWRHGGECERAERLPGALRRAPAARHAAGRDVRGQRPDRHQRAGQPQRGDRPHLAGRAPRHRDAAASRIRAERHRARFRERRLSHRSDRAALRQRAAHARDAQRARTVLDHVRERAQRHVQRHVRETEGIETTGLNRGEDVLHAVQLRATFDAPESLGEGFEEPLTASLGFNYASRYLCDESGFGSEEDEGRCARRTDSIDRDVHFTLETMINDLNIGAQFSLNDRQSFIGLRDGNREFRLAIFANFNFGVGVLPEGLGSTYGY